MKFEIDPNELTADQRAHVAAFITNWPTSYGSHNTKINVNQSGNDGVGSLSDNKIRRFTEEQRLDAEQKSDMDTTGELRDFSGIKEIRESGSTAAVNLNAIFGAPNATPGKVDILPHDSIPSVPLDKEGLPWDSRIHASTKTFIADGTWKLRRGVDPISVDMVKHQLRELMAVPTVTIGSTPPTPEVVSLIPTPPISIGKEMVEQYATDAGAAPIAPVKSHYLIDQQPPATVTLTDLIARMSSAIVAGTMTQATVAEMCAKHGVSEFRLLGSRPDLLPLIDADMKSMGV